MYKKSRLSNHFPDEVQGLIQHYRYLHLNPLIYYFLTMLPGTVLYPEVVGGSWLYPLRAISIKKINFMKRMIEM
jgi:hypothetical protein